MDGFPLGFHLTRKMWYVLATDGPRRQSNRILGRSQHVNPRNRLAAQISCITYRNQGLSCRAGSPCPRCLPPGMTDEVGGKPSER